MVIQRFVIGCVAVLFLSATALAGQDYRFEFQKIISTETAVEVTIHNPSGSVTLFAGTEDELRIDAVKTIYAGSREEAEFVADHVQISVTETDGHITAEPRFLKIQNRSPSFWEKLLGSSGEASHGAVDFVVSVPTRCNADIYISTGKIDVGGVSGNLNLSGEIGEIAVADIQGNVSINNSTGRVTVRDIEGDVLIKANGADISFYSISGDLEIRNSSGLTGGEYLIGDLTVTQTAGQIDVKRVEGDIRIKSTAGAVRVEQDFGALDISTESGDIDITTGLNSSKDYFVETVSGSIRFMVPEASGGEVKLEAGSCDIDTQIPIAIDSFSRTRISGSFGNGGPKISLVTTSGDITLAEF